MVHFYTSFWSLFFCSPAPIHHYHHRGTHKLPNLSTPFLFPLTPRFLSPHSILFYSFFSSHILDNDRQSSILLCVRDSNSFDYFFWCELPYCGRWGIDFYLVKSEHAPGLKSLASFHILHLFLSPTLPLISSSERPLSCLSVSLASFQIGSSVSSQGRNTATLRSGQFNRHTATKSEKFLCLAQ